MTEPVVLVRLLGFPIPVWRVAQEHHEELKREFALLTLAPSRPPDVPQRLLDLVADLSRRFAATTESGNAVRDAAAARGEETVDLDFYVPAAGRDASLALAGMLDEADDYCREGQRLLTLAAPVPAVAFRRWYLAEFVRQIDGLPPRPWPGVAEALRIEVAPARA